MKSKEAGTVGHLIIIGIFLSLAVPAFAGGSKKKPTPIIGQEIVQKVEAEADASSKSHSNSKANGTGIGVGIGKGGHGGDGGTAIAKAGDSKAVVGDTTAKASGGTSKANARSGDVSGAVESDINIQDNGIDVSSFDYASTEFTSTSYSSSYKYEEAAKSAAILYGQVCQDTTNLQGVSFGVGSQKQSTFCQRMSLAVGYLATASMHDCEPPEDVAKGADPVESPQLTRCELDQRRAYLSGVEQMDTARALLDDEKPGFLKKAWNFVW